MAEQVREREFQRAQRALDRGDDPRQILAQLSRTITNKLIHAPTAGLKQASVDGRQDLINNARKLLGMEGHLHQPRAVSDEGDELVEPEAPASELQSTRRTLQ